MRATNAGASDICQAALLLWLQHHSEHHERFLLFEDPAQLSLFDACVSLQHQEHEGLLCAT
jgi:hypothetical protein